MKLHRHLKENLAAAVRSARRFRGQPVHSDTLQFWTDLLDHAQIAGEEGLETRALEQMIVEQRLELAERAT